MHKRVHIIRDNKKLISNQTLEVVTSLSHNQGVLGSSPSGTTNFKNLILSKLVFKIRFFFVNLAAPIV